MPTFAPQPMPPDDASHASDAFAPDDSVDEAPDEASGEAPGKTSVETSGELMASVLGETLQRGADDPHRLLQSLRRWRSTVSPSQLDRSLCVDLVRVALQVRFVQTSHRFPQRMFAEVASVLWDDPEARNRMQRLYAMIGSSDGSDASNPSTGCSGRSGSP